MNYKAFTDGSLTMMYEGIRGALAAEDALEREHRELGPYCGTGGECEAANDIFQP
jgi:hypothetical protein